MDILSWLEGEFGRIGFSSNGNEARVCCPFCSTKDSKQHLYVNTKKSAAHCFRCDWSGSHISLVMQHLGITSYAEALRILSIPTTTTKDFDTIADRLSNIHAARQALINMPTWFVPLSENIGIDSPVRNMVLAYALKRLSPAEISCHQIGWCYDANNKMMWHRLIIPVERGYYQARDICHSDRKYANPEFPIEDRLFNSVALTNYDELLVCEGCISAIAAGSNAVAVLGKHANPKQMERLAHSKADTIVIAFDSDTTYGKGALLLADYLQASGKEVLIRKYAYGDPDNCDEFEDMPYDLRLRVRAGLEHTVTQV